MRRIGMSLPSVISHGASPRLFACKRSCDKRQTSCDSPAPEIQMKQKERNAFANREKTFLAISILGQMDWAIVCEWCDDVNVCHCLTKLSSTFSRIRRSDCHACARMISGVVAASSASAPNNARGREGFGSPGWLHGACGANVPCRKTHLRKRTWRDCLSSFVNVSCDCNGSFGSCNDGTDSAT